MFEKIAGVLGLVLLKLHRVLRLFSVKRLPEQTGWFSNDEFNKKKKSRNQYRSNQRKNNR